MMQLFRSLQERWNDWCGDREMELAIRKHLNQNGYFGSSVKLKDVRLAAVQRPGWVQVYRFDAVARLQEIESDDQASEPTYKKLFGLVKDDARKHGPKVRVFENAIERRSLFLEWSEDLIRLREV